MNATIDGDSVFIDDPATANRIYNKGTFGEPQSGNGLRLSFIEAAYLAHNGRLEFAGEWSDLLQNEVAYLAYADLRDRGLVVRHDGDDFTVWERGKGPGDDPWFNFWATSEREPLRLGQLRPGIVGVVDEDGVVTHYEIQAEEPDGSAMQLDLAAATGTVLADRVLVEGHPFAQEFMGTPHGDRTILSFTEAESLRRREVLDVPDDLASRAAQRQFQFERTLPVYEDLRKRGVAARSGFRFGTHLRGYRSDPDDCHAEWLVQCVGEEEDQPWSHVSRAIRLAHGVRKKFLVAGGDPVQYWHLAWFRP